MTTNQHRRAVTEMGEVRKNSLEKGQQRKGLEWGCLTIHSRKRPSTKDTPEKEITWGDSIRVRRGIRGKRDRP